MDLSIFQDKRIFVTGHLGFKGAWLTLLLQSLGAKVYGYSLLPNTQPILSEIIDTPSQCVASTLGDIRKPHTLREKIQEAAPDIVIHMAAQPLVRESYTLPLDTLETNIMGTAYLLNLCRELPDIRSILVITTDKCYENLEKGLPFQESDPLGGHDPYSASKACTEIVTAAFNTSFFKGTNSLIATARAGNVIGGGDWNKDRLIPDIVRSFSLETPLRLRYPQAIRPWQHVVDSLLGYLLLIIKMEKRENQFCAYNFGPSPHHMKTVGEIFSLCSQYWGGSTQWHQENKQLFHEANTLTLDSSRAEKELGWRPRLTVEEAVEHTIKWYALHKAGACPRQLMDHMLASFQVVLDRSQGS